MSNNTKVGPQEVNKLITDWASPDENTRRPAEQMMEQLLTISNGQINNFVLVLCELLSHPEQTSSEVRERTAILLRTRIAAKLDSKTKKPIFCQLNSSTREQTLKILLKQLSNDPHQNVRNQIADCIIELSTRTFTELSQDYKNVLFLQKIFELYNLSDTKSNNNNNHFDIINRINALSIFGHLCEYCSLDRIIKENQSSIAQIYKVAFKQDSNRKVNIAALEAIQLTMKPLSNEEILSFIPLMFDILKLLENTLNIDSKNDSTEYEQTQYILEIINSITCQHSLIFCDHRKQNTESPLIPYCSAFTQLAITKQLPNKVRELSLEFFLSLSENNPSLVRSKQIIVTSIINICMDHFLLEQIPDLEWNELLYGDDENANNCDLCNCGEYAIDRLIQSLTNKFVLPIIYNKLEIYNSNGNKYFHHNNWRYKHMILTVITQISDHIKHKSKELFICMDNIIQLFESNNTNYRIKYACINCIGQLCHDHYDIIPNKYSDIIIKHLLLILNDNQNNNIKLQIHSCAALINLIPHLEIICEPKLGNLLNTIMNVIKNNNNIKLQEQALTTIAAISSVAKGELFNQYYDGIAPLLMNIIKNASNTKFEDVRCRAIECMGCFGEAVGGNKFKNNAIELMNGTILYFQNENISFDDPFIKTNITVWSRVLQSIGNDEFYKYLSTLCKILNDILNINIISNEDNDNLCIINNNDNVIAIDAQKIENKLAALYTIDSFLDKYNNKMPTEFIEKLFNSLIESCIKCKYSLELRTESIEMSLKYIDIIINCNNNETKQLLLLMCDKLLSIFISILDEGKVNDSSAGESATIGTVCRTLLEFIHKIKDENENILKQFINLNKLEYIIDSMFLCVIRSQNRIELFSKQEANNNYDLIAKEEFKQEKEWEDDLLFDIAQIFAEFIKIYKDEFIQILIKNNNITKLLNFLNPPKSQNIRNPQFIHKTGVYIICDIYEQCNVNNTSKLLNNFIPLIIQIINNDHDLAVQQACFYCLGLMVNKCKNNTINYITKILTLCIQCITKNSNQYINSKISIFNPNNNDNNNNNNNNAQLFEKRKFLGVIDNAMATICKILKDIEWNNISNNQNNLNQLRNQSLSIWLKHLPIKSDTVEAQICHTYLFKLLQNKNPIIIGKNLINLPFIFKIFAMITNTELSTKELDTVLKDFCKTICNSQPQFAQNLSIQEKKNLGL